MLLEVRDLAKSFVSRRDLLGRTTATVAAVAGVGFDLDTGETVGLVGESGSGKSTVGRLVARLLAPDRGTVRLDGRDLTSLRGRHLRAARRDVQMVFQDPYSSLDPSWVVGSIVTEGLAAVGDRPRSSREDRAVELLELVGLRADHARRYPHEFSGGQRQRIAIARALATEPRVLICDEPVSALDVSTQAAILTTLEELQERLGLSLLFVSHDLSVVRHLSDRIAVMYFGRIVEHGPAEAVYEDPQHPYTRALLSAIPRVSNADRRARIRLHGELPNPSQPPPGCAFVTRCPHSVDVCGQRSPSLGRLDDGARTVACHLLTPLPAPVDAPTVPNLNPPTTTP